MAPDPETEAKPTEGVIAPAASVIEACLADVVVEDLRGRLLRRRRMRAPDGGWDMGVPGAWLSELLDDWARFDVAGLRRRLAAEDHRLVDLDGQRIHALVVEGSGPAPVPLLLTHGWPGSFLEYRDLIPRLIDPVADEDAPPLAFTVVAPSLPGFGFSEAAGLTSRETAGMWNELMRRLGYPRYVAHGSDLGAGVTDWLARDHGDSVIAIHLATPGIAWGSPRGDEEHRYAAEVERWVAAEGAYMHEHATKPATLGAALADSPVAIAAWIAEKVMAWSSLSPTGESAFPRERLLETLTLYWATDTIATSLLPYWTYGRRPETQPPLDAPSRTPAAVSIFGGERVPFVKPPRSLAHRAFTLSHWIEHDCGGHFPAVAEPAVLARDLRRVFAGSGALLAASTATGR